MERIFYKSDTVDAYTGYPIYVFDTSYLPPTSAINYEHFIPTMMRSLPKHPYEVIMFSGGLNKISWIWGIKFLKSFLADSGQNVENLHKIFAVHESWFVRSVTQIFTNFSGSKNPLATLNSLFDKKKTGYSMLTSCESLGDLSNFVDITKLKLSLNVYKHDAEVTMTTAITVSFPVDDILTPESNFTTQNPAFYHHFYQLFHIVDMYGPRVELVFHRPGNRMSTEILLSCIRRNQLLWINDWDLYCIASCFKKILLEVSTPLLPVDAIELPMSDDFDYVLAVFENILDLGKPAGADVVLFQCMELCKRIVDHDNTRHTYTTILRSLCHSLTHESVSHQNRDRMSVAVRFIKSVLVYWDELHAKYGKRYKTVAMIANGDDLVDATIDELYNMSQDITMGKEDDDGEERCDDIAITTENSTESFEVLLEISERGGSGEKGDSSENGGFGEKCGFGETAVLGAEVGRYGSGNGSSENTGRHSGKQYYSGRETSEGDLETRLGAVSLSGTVEETDKASEKSASEKSASTDLFSSSDTGAAKASLPPGTSTSASTSGNDIPNVHLQFPPQKYKFERAKVLAHSNNTNITSPTKKEQIFRTPVVRGRKVGELTRLFEERAHAMDLLRTL